MIRRTPASRQNSQIDYAKELTPAEREWIIKFDGEFHSGRFIGEALHPDHLRKDCYDRSNSSRRDLLSHAPLAEPSEGQAHPLDTIADEGSMYEMTCSTLVDAVPRKKQEPEPKPIKTLSAQELETFAKARGFSVSKPSTKKVGII